MFLSFLFSVLKECFESLRNVFVSSDNQFGFKRFLSSSHAIYSTVKSVGNEYRGILSGGILWDRPQSESLTLNAWDLLGLQLYAIMIIQHRRDDSKLKAALSLHTT